MREFYIDTFNCLIVPEKTANLEKIISDFYKSDKAPVNDDTVSVGASAAFSRNAYHSKVLGINVEKLEYPIFNSVYAYAVCNGVKAVMFEYVENDSQVKKLYLPASVERLGFQTKAWVNSENKSGNVWIDVAKDNPYFYSDKGSVYQREDDSVIYLYLEPSEENNLNKKVCVKNLNGTSGKDCKCGSWLKHWINFNSKATATIPPICPACQKEMKWTDVVGAHVQKEDDNHWYIIPLCKECNKISAYKIFDVEDVGFAWANINETCLKYKNRYQFVKDYLSLNKK